VPLNVTGGWTDSVAVISDVCHLWFGYSRYDFGRLFAAINATPPTVVFDPAGPARPGVTGDRFQLFHADLTPAGWTETYLPQGRSAASGVGARGPPTRTRTSSSGCVA